MKGLGESTCFIRSARSFFSTFLMDGTQISLVIESLTRFLISGDQSCCFLCRFGDVGSDGSCHSVWTLLLQSKDEKVVDEQEEEKEFLDDSMEDLFFSIVTFFGFFSCIIQNSGKYLNFCSVSDMVS